ncbi:MAG TPA: DNA translocase FtsK [Candidatus Deferrimicrobium sp.]|nr:DNA translocase FtsK [Candidatus Deferrimicrobium sp.]
MGESEKRHRTRTGLKIDIKYATAGVILISLSIIALLGFFEAGGVVGLKLAALFKSVLGKAAWLGPFITITLGGFLVAYQPEAKTKPVKAKPERMESKKTPVTETVSKGRGFKEYFADVDPMNENKQEAEPFTELEEVGQDFRSYFGNNEGRVTASKAKIVKLEKGFGSYFSDDEVACAGTPEVVAEQVAPPVPQAKKEFLGFRAFINKINKEEPEPSIQVQEPRQEPKHEVTQELIQASTQALGQESELSLDMEEEPVLVPEVTPQVPFRSSRENLVVLQETKQAKDITAVQVELGIKPEPKTVVQPPMAVLAPRLPQQISLPPEILLDPPIPVISQDNIAQQNARILEHVLDNFGVKVRVTEISQGPAITRYEVQPAPGIKISRIVNLADDIALGLAARDIRIEAPIPGKSAVGIEVPNKKVNAVRFREVLESKEFDRSSKLQVALGKDIAGNSVVADLARMPHLLVAGATGSGKSVCMNTIITSILYNARPDEVKFLLIDPKMVELTNYNGIPHLIAPVVTDPKKAATALRWVVNEMETRYELFAASGVRDITRYNEVNSTTPPMPFIMVLIDELADLMMVAPGDIEEAICRLAQMARAAGIHLVVATQRPSVDVITGIIKANIPSRIAFAVSSQIDSRTIIDGNGAEKLLGKGDMLYYPMGMSKPLRVQGCFLSDNEVERVVKHWKGQAKPEYMSIHFEEYAKNSEEELADDELFAEAARLFITSGMASVSLLQRRLRVGYTRAARLMDLLEQKGIVGGFEGSKPRQVLMSISEFEEQFSNNA